MYAKKGNNAQTWGYQNTTVPTRDDAVGLRPSNLIEAFSRACLGSLHAWNCQNWTAGRFFVAANAKRILNAYCCSKGLKCYF